jgi:DNA-binding transcriptional LysR family regulator
MFPELNIDWLRTFLAVADSRSFTKASQAVFRSQAAVSMQIKRLEESIEKPLFVRDTRNLELTRTGESLLPYARRLLNLHDETWSALVQPEVQGQVLLGAPDDYVSSLLPDVLRKFSSIYPRVTIELTCAPSTALAPMLTDNKIDMAILTRARGIKGKFIRSEPMCWATIADSDAWSRRPLPVALFEIGCACRIRAEQALKRGNLPYRIVCSSPSMTGLVTTVEAGLAVAALARCSVPKNLKVIGRKEGLPDLERLEILIGRSTRGKTTPCEVMEELIEETLTQPD